MNTEKNILLESFYDILNSTTSIKLHIERVDELRQKLRDSLSVEEQLVLSSKIKNRVQGEVEEAFYCNTSGFGAAYMATGSGKSKVGIDISSQIVSNNPSASILVVVPTEKLRDENWKEEFQKWGKIDIWNNNVERCCYASLNKYENNKFDFVILDEGHNITENNSEFFNQNEVSKCLLLTATKPKDVIKLQILKELNINPFYEISLDEAVLLGLVAPYDITIITTTLDNTNKYLKTEYKDKKTGEKKSFLTTEKQQYDFLSTIKSLQFSGKMGYIKRMQFIYNLRSKTEIAKQLLENYIPQDLRTVIFCGSKDQANQVCEHRFYSKPSPPKKLTEKATPAKVEKYEQEMIRYRANLLEYRGDISLDAFKREEINRLACVEALNEGQNIPKPDVGFIIQLNSNELDLIQRLGRLIRYRPGHIGKIIILCCIDTVDFNWLKKATVNLNVNNIEEISFEDLKDGTKVLTF